MTIRSMLQSRGVIDLDEAVQVIEELAAEMRMRAEDVIKELDGVLVRE